ncbi:MAG TPA: HAMP domain-containing sensor histidine kinase [Candidatus Saccharimonas sp.]|nr:HAMP domain-containing sensor histidine kinase [Candidatus Saccharimonas sp.]
MITRSRLTQLWTKLVQLWTHRSPAFKLAAAYVAIIMVVSLVFSLTLYRLASTQLEDSLRRQYIRLRALPNGAIVPVIISPGIQSELESGENRLAWQLLYFNGVILIAGSGLSYWLAGRTLQPIERALESQSRFAADASHELRTPLAAMQTEIEVALRNPKLTRDEAVTQLASNLEEVAKLRALSDGLLRLAHQENGSAETEPVQLETVITEAIDRLKSAAEAKHILMVAETTPAAVHGDTHALTDLVAILLDNAIKYSPSKTQVTVNLQRHGNGAVLTVADQGPGIAAADLPHVFDRFYRADKSRSGSAVHGYGLGLSIATQIARTHDATIKADSPATGGAVFTVSFQQAS